jgi:L-ribulose-5-phosphate 3-epimerase
MMISRRHFLRTAASGLTTASAASARGLKRLKIGVTDWNLGRTGKVDAVELAKNLGFAGVEISLGRRPGNDRLPLDNDELIAEYLAAFKKNNFRPAGACLDILHVNYLKNDKLGQKWVADGIGVTKRLGAKVMLLPFFGKGALQNAAEKEYVGDALRDLGPVAESAGVILGLENTISAEDNVRIIERTRSKAVLVYYDIGNSTNNGFDVAREIEWLGRKRICQMHFKDNPNYLGQGKIDVPNVVRAVSRIGFEGFANLETSNPSKSVEADMKRNLAYITKVIADVERS